MFWRNMDLSPLLKLGIVSRYTLFYNTICFLLKSLWYIIRSRAGVVFLLTSIIFNTELAFIWSFFEQEVGLRGLTSKRHMKIILRWMRERQKLKLICNHVGPHKQFLYTTWFTKHNPSKFSKPPENLTGKSSGHPKLPWLVTVWFKNFFLESSLLYFNVTKMSFLTSFSRWLRLYTFIVT